MIRTHADVSIPQAAIDAGLRDFMPTGSRLYCLETVDDAISDFDFLCRGTPQIVKKLGGARTGGNYGDDFESLRFDDVNLIVAFDDDAYGRWANATALACVLDVSERLHRQALFRAVVDGVWPKRPFLIRTESDEEAPE